MMPWGGGLPLPLTAGGTYVLASHCRPPPSLSHLSPRSLLIDSNDSKSLILVVEYPSPPSPLDLTHTIGPQVYSSIHPSSSSRAGNSYTRPEAKATLPQAKTPEPVCRSARHPLSPLLHKFSEHYHKGMNSISPSGGSYSAFSKQSSSSPVPSLESSLATSMSRASSARSMSPSGAASSHGSISMSSDARTDDSNAGDDDSFSLVVCQWNDCGQTYEDPEILYQHLCNDHVGRKSTNNLCLTCHWIGCDAVCAKRDHITSHLRVHTPLKPHSCASCGKMFKRPQDLKKHERIHTEDHQMKQAQTKVHKQQASALAKENTKRQQQQQQQAEERRFHQQQQAHLAHQQRHHAAMASQPHPQLHQQYQPFGSNVYSSTGNPVFYPQGVGMPSHRGYTSDWTQNMRQQSPSASGRLAPQHERRDGSVSSLASLSPSSSHLGTPYSSEASPRNHYQQAQQSTQGMVGGEYPLNSSYLALASGTQRSKPSEDPNSYTFLSQGSRASSIASSASLKRGYDDLLTGVDGLLQDTRKKRPSESQSLPDADQSYSSLVGSSPAYDANMADKLSSTFGSTFDDDAILQALLNGSNVNDAGSASSHQGGSHMPTFALNGHSAGPQGPHRGAPGIGPTTASAPAFSASLPTDPHKLAELNHFLLQLGNSAARDLNGAMASHGNGSQQPSSSGAFDAAAFDMNSLGAMGLTNIAGFDSSLFSNGDASYLDLGQQQQPPRAIASMPRQQGTTNGGHFQSHQQQHTAQGNGGQTAAGFASPMGSLYPSLTPHHGLQTMAQSQPQQQAQHLPYGSGAASFDSVRMPRGAGVKPTLSSVDSRSHTFRRVDPLMRAAPTEIEARSVDTETHDVDDRKSSLAPIRSPQPPTASVSDERHDDAAHILASIDGTRRGATALAATDSARPAPILPSISSLLSSRDLPPPPAMGTAGHTWRSSRKESYGTTVDTRTTTPSSTGSPTDTSSSSSAFRSTSPAPPSSLYPSLPGADTLMAKMALAPGSSGDVSLETRIRHVKLIKSLLLAINFPERLQSILGHTRAEADDEEMDVEEHDEEMYDEGRRTPRPNSSPDTVKEQDQKDDEQDDTPPVSKSASKDWLSTVVGPKTDTFADRWRRTGQQDGVDV
ncbi:hypothetical protein BCV69DRAFT_284170 [Microstroma glucosiphilum]|uniref:C2H2-type domain-containing protein n=1 Tax=Pseudomicrostroma glucosiphilum TaxID=1684307 RepID=A0A316U520_9BASI|nr:hypothetical protein BCV69DRAFT_284170 [Pseudomicrostroma glucosiphilum]PWN19541.1 hypothetical protein BCV69DRAFT_284170 [Pseudomicrostroma glucosiphilum]